MTKHINVNILKDLPTNFMSLVILSIVKHFLKPSGLSLIGSNVYASDEVNLRDH